MVNHKTAVLELAHPKPQKRQVHHVVSENPICPTCKGLCERFNKHTHEFDTCPTCKGLGEMVQDK